MYVESNCTLNQTVIGTELENYCETDEEGNNFHIILRRDCQNTGVCIV